MERTTRTAPFRASLLSLLVVAAACGSSSTDAEGSATTNGETEVAGRVTEAPPTTDATTTSQASTAEAPDAAEEPVRLVIDAWNNHDLGQGYREAHPDNIEFELTPTESSEFDADLLARFEAGSAGDIIACRPYDQSLTLFEAGYLADLSAIDTPRIPDFAYTAWQDGEGHRYCIPVSSVAFGFLYNEDIFDELGLEPPTDMEQFEQVLQDILDDGRYIPLAIGSENPSRIDTFLMGNLGPSFWGGEEGRLAIAHGDVAVADSGLMDLYDLMARWSVYLPDAHEQVDPDDASSLFILGDAAIRPIGSWTLGEYVNPDGSTSETGAQFPVGSFPAPGRNAGDSCVVVSPLDLAYGMNPSTEHPEETLQVLEYLASEDYARFLGREKQGLYSLQRPLPDPPAAGPGEWIAACEQSLRVADTGYGSYASEARELSWNLAAGLTQGKVTPAEAAVRFQAVVDKANE